MIFAILLVSIYVTVQAIYSALIEMFEELY